MSATTNVSNFYDGNGQALGPTLNTIGRTANYKVYSGTLTAGGSPLVLDVYTDLGMPGTRASILNLSATSTTNFTIAFSVDGTNYGDAITFYTTFGRNYDFWLPFQKIKLTRVSADSTYDITVI